MTWTPERPDSEPRVFALGPRVSLVLWPEEGIEPTGRLHGVVLGRAPGESAAVRIECGTDALPALERLAAGTHGMTGWRARWPTPAAALFAAACLGAAAGAGGWLVMAGIAVGDRDQPAAVVQVLPDREERAPPASAMRQVDRDALQNAPALVPVERTPEPAPLGLESVPAMEPAAADASVPAGEWLRSRREEERLRAGGTGP